MGKIVPKVVFCDDIRQEISGKFILIGVYIGEMILFQVPAKVSLATWIEVIGLDPGEHKMRAKVTFTTEDGTIVAGELGWNSTIIRPDLPAAIGPTGLPLELEKSGTVAVYLTVDDHEEILAGELKVSLQAAPLATQ